jgi:hypothetical protein
VQAAAVHEQAAYVATVVEALEACAPLAQAPAVAAHLADGERPPDERVEIAAADDGVRRWSAGAPRAAASSSTTTVAGDRGPARPWWSCSLP